MYDSTSDLYQYEIEYVKSNRHSFDGTQTPDNQVQLFGFSHSRDYQHVAELFFLTAALKLVSVDFGDGVVGGFSFFFNFL